MHIFDDYYEAKIVILVGDSILKNFDIQIVGTEKTRNWGTRYIIRSKKKENILKFVEEINDTFQGTSMLEDELIDIEDLEIKHIKNNKKIKYFNPWELLFTK